MWHPAHPRCGLYIPPHRRGQPWYIERPHDRALNKHQRWQPTAHDFCADCGDPRWQRHDCPAREHTCEHCGTKGHFPRLCMVPPAAGLPRTERRVGKRNNNEQNRWRDQEQSATDGRERAPLALQRELEWHLEYLEEDDRQVILPHDYCMELDIDLMEQSSAPAHMNDLAEKTDADVHDISVAQCVSHSKLQLTITGSSRMTLKMAEEKWLKVLRVKRRKMRRPRKDRARTIRAHAPMQDATGCTVSRDRPGRQAKGRDEEEHAKGRKKGRESDAVVSGPGRRCAEGGCSDVRPRKEMCRRGNVRPRKGMGRRQNALKKMKCNDVTPRKGKCEKKMNTQKEERRGGM